MLTAQPTLLTCLSPRFQNLSSVSVIFINHCTSIAEPLSSTKCFKYATSAVLFSVYAVFSGNTWTSLTNHLHRPRFRHSRIISIYVLQHVLLYCRTHSLKIKSLIACPFHNPSIPPHFQTRNPHCLVPVQAVRAPALPPDHLTCNALLPLVPSRFSSKFSCQIPGPPSPYPFHAVLTFPRLSPSTLHLEPIQVQRHGGRYVEQLAYTCIFLFNASFHNISTFPKSFPSVQSLTPDPLLLYHSWNWLSRPSQVTDTKGQAWHTAALPSYLYKTASKAQQKNPRSSWIRYLHYLQHVCTLPNGHAWSSKCRRLLAIPALAFIHCSTSTFYIELHKKSISLPAPFRRS